MDADGYCSQCGLRRPASHDHEEREIDSGLAGVTDRGLRHHRNEDAQALARGVEGGAVLVVCDGVSTTQRPDDASQAAADVALATLLAAPAAADPAALEEATRTAVAAAQDAVLAIPYDGTLVSLGPPSCTIVTAVVRPGGVTVGWVGDSRAYRVHADGAVTALSVDHSWAAEQVASGVMSEPDAQQDPRAHVITRWLGADAPKLDTPVVTAGLDPGDRVLLCTDGLWNYTDTPGALAKLIAQQAAGAGAADLARTLVAYARYCGGHDNITVAICDPLPPTASPTLSAPPEATPSAPSEETPSSPPEETA